MLFKNDNRPYGKFYDCQERLIFINDNSYAEIAEIKNQTTDVSLFMS